MTSTYLVIGQQCWGAAETLDEAKANFRKQGGRLNQHHGVYEFDDETTFKGIDQMGRMHYVGNSPTLTERRKPVST